MSSCIILAAALLLLLCAYANGVDVTTSAGPGDFFQPTVPRQTLPDTQFRSTFTDDRNEVAALTTNGDYSDYTSDEFSSSEEIGRAGGSTKRPSHHKKHRHRTTTIAPAALTTTTFRTTTRRAGTFADTGFSSINPIRNTTPPPQALPEVNRDKPFRDPLPSTSVQPIRPDNGASFPTTLGIGGGFTNGPISVGPISGIPITGLPNTGGPITGSTVGLTSGYPQSVTPSVPFDDAVNYTGRDELYHDRRERPARPVDPLDPEKKVRFCFVCGVINIILCSIQL